MKRKFTAFLLFLLLMMGSSLIVSARDMEYFEEDGVQYCWVRGAKEEEPKMVVPGYTWVLSYKDGKLETRLGECELEHEVCDIYCYSGRLEYKWKLVIKEIMMVKSLNPDDYAMTGAQFILLKQEIKKDSDGNYELDSEGKLQYFSEVVGKGEVEIDGFARLRLDEKRLEPESDFLQLLLGQILPESQMDTYCSIQKRWYINLVLNDTGVYEVYSVTEAPAANITDPEALKDSNFGIKGETSVSEYNSKKQILTTRNEYRVGDLIIDIIMDGFDGDIPSRAKPNIVITGPNDYRKRLRSSDTLADMRMGLYTITCSEPVDIAGYTAEEGPVIKVECPVGTEPVELTDEVNTVLLNRNHANAKVYITYTYTPEHVHIYDEGVVTNPTCTEKGYTTFTCVDEACDYFYRSEYEDAYGHDYEEEHHEATCTVDGYTVYTCTDCGHTYQKDGTPKIGHNFKDKVISPTCTEKGYTLRTCEICGFTHRDNEIEANGHDHRVTGIKEPTCTEDGVIYKACLNCDDKFTESGEKATGHQPVYSHVLAPTCTEKGYTVYKCTKCSSELKEDGEPAIGHDYDKGKVTAPTCTEKGYTTYTCQNDGCNYSYTGNEVKALGHSYITKVIEPTTEREGYTLHTCSVCGDEYTDNHKDKLPEEDDYEEEPVDSGATAPGTTSSNTATNGNTATNNNTTASANAADTLIVKSVDEQGEPLSGTMVALYNGQTQLRKWACSYDNVSVLDNLEKYAKEGESVSLTLVQTKAPNGYDISEDIFMVLISKRGGKTEVSVQKSGGNGGSSVENGKDGKPIVTFCNMKKTTQIEISCQVNVKFGENCEVDEAIIAAYQEKQYDFTLSWKDSAGEEQTESVRLSHGMNALLNAKLPFGTQYEIAGIDEEGNVVTELSENASGTLSALQVNDKVAVEADLKYMVWTGEPLELNMMVVDAESGEALEGATFELRDPDGTKLGTYFSHKNGKVFISDVFRVTGDYLLTQTKAPEGYEPINGAAPVMVSLTCAPNAEAGNQILVQYMEAKIAHQAVSQDTDGMFQIKNAPQGTQIGQTGKGSSLGIVLGIAGCLAAAGGATAFVLFRRKRKQSSES